MKDQSDLQAGGGMSALMHTYMERLASERGGARIQIIDTGCSYQRLLQSIGGATPPVLLRKGG